MSDKIRATIQMCIAPDPNNEDLGIEIPCGDLVSLADDIDDWQEEDHEDSLDLEPNDPAIITAAVSSKKGSGNNIGEFVKGAAATNSALAASNADIVVETEEEASWLDKAWDITKRAGSQAFDITKNALEYSGPGLMVKYAAWAVENPMEALHTTLDVAGLAPGLGEIADGINALIYFIEGDDVNGALSLAAMIPFAGWGATGGKLGLKLAKAFPKATKIAKNAYQKGSELIDKASKKIDELAEAAVDKVKNLFNRKKKDGGSVKGNDGSSNQGGSNNKNPCFDNGKSLIGGKPVDAATGTKILYDEEDTFLLGKLPITIDRSYDSDLKNSSIFGEGWQFAYHLSLKEQSDHLIYTTRHGRVVELPLKYELLETVFVTNENFWFRKEDHNHYLLWNMSGTHFHFKRCEVERTLFRLVAITQKTGAHLAFHYDSPFSGIVENITPQIVKITDQLTNDAVLLNYKEIEIKGVKEVRIDSINHQYYSGLEELVIRYEYGSSGQLAKVIDKNNIVQRSFFYNEQNLMVKHCYASGLQSEYIWQEFEDRPRVIRSFDNRGKSYDIEYLLDQRITKATDHRGLTESFYYNETNYITRYIDFDGSESTYQYNHNDVMISAQLSTGLSYRFEVDQFNRHTKVVEEGIDPITNEKVFREKNFNYFRDTFNMTRYQDPEGNFWNTGYGTSDQVIDESTPLGETTHYYYNQQNDLVKRIDANQNEFLYQWNKRGQLLRKIDCSGHKTHYQYDEKGLLTKVTDALKHETLYRYDNENRLIEVIDPENQRESITYNDFGGVAVFTDKAGKKIHYQYDETGQLVGIKDRLGRTIAYEYDPVGHLLSLTNQNGAKYCFEYDAGGRLIREDRIDKTALEYQYDDSGLLTRVDHIGDRGGIRSTKYTLNAWNELLIKAHENYQNHYRYNANGALISAHRSPNTMDDHLIHPLRFEYDGNGQLIAEHSPDGSLFYSHDALGNLQDVTLPSGDRIDYLRYGSGYVHGILWNRDEIINFEHNALHQETLRTLGSRQLTTEYDGLGRMSAQRYDDLSPKHPLDAGIQGQRSNLNRHFSYNALDELIELTDSLKGNRKYQYDAEGRLESYHSAIFPEIPGSGDWESFSYDSADNILNQHPTSLSAHDDSIKTNRVNDYNGEIYTYNEWGDLLSIYHQQKRRGFKFNAAGLLVSSSGQHGGKNYSVAYEYDALDRRIQKSVSYFEDEHLEKLKEQKETHFLWMGMQMIEERESLKKGMTNELASDLLARNINPEKYIVPPEESIYRYIYRPDGSYEPLAQIRQLSASEIAENQRTDQTTWRQVPSIREMEIAERIKAEAGITLSAESVKNYEIRYYQNHINGAPEELVDFAGNILWAENATAWGKDQYDIETTQRGTHQPIRFQGQYRDAETGLHYNTFRYYNPHNGRFISQDPIGLNGGINLYQYAPNPISWVDPWGWQATSRAEYRKALRDMNVSTSRPRETHKYVYDGSTENRTIYTHRDSAENKRYVVKHENDQVGHKDPNIGKDRGAHYHTVDELDSSGKRSDPHKKGRYAQGDGHYPENPDGFGPNKNKGC